MNLLLPLACNINTFYLIKIIGQHRSKTGMCIENRGRAIDALGFYGNKKKSIQRNTDRGPQRHIVDRGG